MVDLLRSQRADRIDAVPQIRRMGRKRNHADVRRVRIFPDCTDVLGKNGADNQFDSLGDRQFGSFSGSFGRSFGVVKLQHQTVAGNVEQRHHRRIAQGFARFRRLSA